MIHVFWFIALVLVAVVAYRTGRHSASCRHIWRVHNRADVITTRGDGKEKEQTVETLICENCGEIVRINLTTGESTTLVNGGPAYKDETEVK